VKCSICEKEKKKVLDGLPIICFACFRKLNGITKKMPKIYYQGFRDGKVHGRREEFNRLRKILFKRGSKELIEALCTQQF